MTEKLAKKLEKKPAKGQAVKAAPADRGELVSSMEPMLISTECMHRGRLTSWYSSLIPPLPSSRTSLPDGMVAAICDVVRSMNCYYSNLIEGHYTHPVDIERALAGDYSEDKEKRNLQKEAKAHIATQRWIDEGALAARRPPSKPCSTSTGALNVLCPLTCSGSRNPELDGVRRSSRASCVTVMCGSASISRSARALCRASQALGGRLCPARQIGDGSAGRRGASSPALDPPLLRRQWPGRAADLLRYATQALNSGGIWSIARGLARKQDEYKAHLASCDLQRRNDLDGRGNLSEEELASFSAFFLETCLDQVKFMAELMQPGALRKRVLDWARGEEQVGSLMPSSTKVLAHILTHRELERKDMPEVTGFKMDKARRVAALLNKRGIIKSDTHKSPFRIAFPAELAPGLLPGLYPTLPQRT